MAEVSIDSLVENVFFSNFQGIFLVFDVNISFSEGTRCGLIEMKTVSTSVKTYPVSQNKQLGRKRVRESSGVVYVHL